MTAEQRYEEWKRQKKSRYNGRETMDSAIDVNQKQGTNMVTPVLAEILEQEVLLELSEDQIKEKECGTGLPGHQRVEDGSSR
jgi:hypothetical protein